MGVEDARAGVILVDVIPGVSMTIWRQAFAGSKVGCPFRGASLSWDVDSIFSVCERSTACQELGGRDKEHQKDSGFERLKAAAHCGSLRRFVSQA